MIDIGKIYSVTVVEKIQSGYFVEEEHTKTKIFLPKRMLTTKLEIDSKLDVFVYRDTKGQLTASQEHPFANVDEYALMKVKEVHEFGAFFNWGIDKDLLVPGNQQKVDVRVGEYHLLRVCIEQRTQRIYGTTKLGQWIENSDFNIEEKDQVELKPVSETDLGYRVVINKKFIGMIYHNEIFQKLEINENYKGYVKKIRIDGLVDCALQIQGIKNLDAATSKVMQMLRKQGGSSPLNDKSSPEQIKRALGMSKKTFKSAIGMLYKRRKIMINKEGISISK